MGRVTRIDDPLRLNRIKVKLWWQKELNEYESDWLQQGTLFAGPVDKQRGIDAWGLDYPLPEINSDVFVFFMEGNPYDGYYFGVPRFGLNERASPRIEKDKKIQFSLRIKLPNGYEFAVGTEGDALHLVNGHYRSKVQGNWHQSARGKLKQTTVRLVQGALSIIKKVSPTIQEVHYIRPDDDPELRDDLIDMMDGVPGREDPGIRKPEDLS